MVVLKGSTSLVATPDGELFAYAGGGVGLATGGSGDVLAGIVAGLAARGAEPLEATLWAVWLHGEAGRRCAEQLGPLGFLARELLAHVPGLMRGVLAAGLIRPVPSRLAQVVVHGDRRHRRLAHRDADLVEPGDHVARGI